MESEENGKENGKEKAKKTLALAMQTFVAASPGPWVIDENANFPKNNDNYRQFRIKNADGKEIADLICRAEDARLIMTAVGNFPDFIKTLHSVLQIGEEGENEPDEKGN